MNYKDYYDIMGLKKTASQDEIKRAYRKLARKFHPDVSKDANAETRFKEVGEAYEVLKDPEKRRAYDQLGENWQAGQDFNPPPDWDNGFEFRSGFNGAHNTSYSDFFESLFGHNFASAHGAQSQRGFNHRGEDHHAKVLIDLEDAYKGATRTITLNAVEMDSNGRPISKQRNLNVKIPKGVKQGQKIRLSGQGAAGIGSAAAGDLYLEIEFKAHPFYRIDDYDVYLDLPLAPWELALGATVKVPTPDGLVDLKIAPGTSSGKKMRLKGRGIPAATPGDLYVVPQVVLPPAKNDAAKQLYKQMQQELNFNPRQALGV